MCNFTRYVIVCSQCVADEGHIGAGSGVSDGNHVWVFASSSSTAASSSSSSRFGQLLLVRVDLPDLFPICKRQYRRKISIQGRGKDCTVKRRRVVHGASDFPSLDRCYLLIIKRNAQRNSHAVTHMECRSAVR